MDFMLKLEEVNGMLGLFQNYWPTFKIQEGQAEAWAFALKDYSREELWESLRQFRSEEQRIFAPTISELIGRTDTLRAVREQKATDTKLLEAPTRERSEAEPMEVYSYKTTRTSPKRNKDDSDTEIRKAIRVSPQRKQEIEQRAIKDGYQKITIDLGNGRTGFEFRRPIYTIMS